MKRKVEPVAAGVNDFTHLVGFGVFVDSGSSQVPFATFDQTDS